VSEIGSSKWLAYAEKKIEVMQALRLEIASELSGWSYQALNIACRIQIVAEVKAQWTDRCLITQPYTKGM
jgi:hypothetical protein